MQPTLVINVVGLTPALIGARTPNIQRFVNKGVLRPLRTVTPAVTCSVQTTFVTGLLPAEHGIVGNGWLFRDLLEIWFWRQSNKLLHGERIWEAGKTRDANFTCANLFWWYAMASSADFSVTPRPIYKADGRKIPDCYSDPPEIRNELTERLGQFPLFQFWGPATTIASSRWIADAAKHMMRTRNPTLTLVYLPHLDYVLQRLGPEHADIWNDVAEIDAVVGDLIADAEALGRKVIILSEYGIVPVQTPVHINRALHRAGLLAVRDELGGEILDVSRCRAFAVADHQIAHIYIADPSDVTTVRSILEGIDGIDIVLDDDGKHAHGLDHIRSGELIVIAKPDAWFTYYYWIDDARAPDFARTVEIHRKPGYDPVELFLDPKIAMPKLALGWRLAKKALGFRTLMDVIPLDATLVKGSHGRADTPTKHGPVFISSESRLVPNEMVDARQVKSILLDHVFDSSD
jgi:predicted AlkP superfamily pyrophosphatase or phosphodiesterase